MCSPNTTRPRWRKIARYHSAAPWSDASGADFDGIENSNTVDTLSLRRVHTSQTQNELPARAGTIRPRSEQPQPDLGTSSWPSHQSQQDDDEVMTTLYGDSPSEAWRGQGQQLLRWSHGVPGRNGLASITTRLDKSPRSDVGTKIEGGLGFSPRAATVAVSAVVCRAGWPSCSYL